MINVDDVGRDIFSKVEGSIWRNVQRMMSYDWYAAGRAISIAPSEHEMIEYGREWALARYMQDGGRWQDAVEEATKATYRYAYDDIKHYIFYSKHLPERVNIHTMIYDMSETGLSDGTETWERAWGTTFDNMANIFYHQPEYDEIEFENTIASFENLNDIERQIALWKTRGLTHGEMADLSGFSRQWISAIWKNLRKKLRTIYE